MMSPPFSFPVVLDYFFSLQQLLKFENFSIHLLFSRYLDEKNAFQKLKMRFSSIY